MFFDPTTPLMRKGRDGGETEKKNGGKKTDDYSSQYVIVRSPLPERRPLERRTLAKIKICIKVCPPILKKVLSYKGVLIKGLHINCLHKTVLPKRNIGKIKNLLDAKTFASVV